MPFIDAVLAERDKRAPELTNLDLFLELLQLPFKGGREGILLLLHEAITHAERGQVHKPWPMRDGFPVGFLHCFLWEVNFMASRIEQECCALQSRVAQLEQELQQARSERDAAREQLQKIGRKAFWASR